MALTKQDLSAISQLLDVKFKAELQPLKDDIHDLKVDVQGLKEDVRVLNVDVQGLKEDVQILKVDVQGLKEDVQILKERTQVLEEDVQILKDGVRNTNVHLELVTDRNIRLLAENYLPAAKRFEKASEQIESMQIDIDILKKVTAEHSEKLQMIS